MRASAAPARARPPTRRRSPRPASTLNAPIRKQHGRHRAAIARGLPSRRVTACGAGRLRLYASSRARPVRHPAMPSTERSPHRRPLARRRSVATTTARSRMRSRCRPCTDRSCRCSEGSVRSACRALTKRSLVRHEPVRLVRAPQRRLARNARVRPYRRARSTAHRREPFDSYRRGSYRRARRSCS